MIACVGILNSSDLYKNYKINTFEIEKQKLPALFRRILLLWQICSCHLSRNMSVEIPLTSYVERGCSHRFHLFTLPHHTPHPLAHAYSYRTAAAAGARAARLFEINLGPSGG